MVLAILLAVPTGGVLHPPRMHSNRLRQQVVQVHLCQEMGLCLHVGLAAMLRLRDSNEWRPSPMMELDIASTGWRSSQKMELDSVDL